MRSRTVAQIGILLLFGAGSATAQVLVPTGGPPPKGITLDVLKPALDQDAFGAEFTTLTTITHLGFGWAFGNISVTADLPYVNVGATDAFGGGSITSTLLGNIGIGVATTATAGFQGGMEVLLPTFSGGGDDDGVTASLIGLIGDYQGFEAYLDEVTSIRGTVGYRWALSSGPSIRAVLRPVVLSPKNGDTELVTDLGAAVDYGQGWWTAGAGLTGRYWITEDAANLPFGKLVTELDLGFRGTFGSFQPGLYLRVPLDSDLNDGLGPSLGLRLSYAFGK